MSIRRGLLASSLLSVILGVWLVAQVVPLGAVGSCARYQFAQAMNSGDGQILAPTQETARTPCSQLWSQDVTLDVRTAAVFTLAHTLWISLALGLASALFGLAPQRIWPPLLGGTTGQDEASNTLLGEPPPHPEDPPLT
ncbi:MAG: hypothetical protein ACREII_08490, partial [Nitrospiraceae bacterium]